MKGYKGSKVANVMGKTSWEIHSGENYKEDLLYRFLFIKFEDKENKKAWHVDNHATLF